MYRQDSTGTSGGILSWDHKDIPHRCKDEIEEENECIQSLCLEKYIKKQKWMLVSLYCLPKQYKADLDMFSSSVNKMVDQISADTDMIIMIGDFNIDPLKCEPKSRMLCGLMSVNNIKNIIKCPTCFKGDPPSTIDLCLFTKPRCFGKMLNYNCDLSDWHNMIAVCTKITIAKQKPKEVMCRSYKNFDKVKFVRNIEMIPFHVTEVFDVSKMNPRKATGFDQLSSKVTKSRD